MASYNEIINESVEAEISMRGITIKTAVGIEAILVTIILHCSMPLNTQNKEAEEFKIKRLSFGDLAAKARKLLKRFHPDLHKQNAWLFSNIEKVVIVRNWFAHCPILWKDRINGIFEFQDTKVDKNGFEYNSHTEYSRLETTKFLEFVFKEVIPPLSILSTEVQLRLKASHPELFSLIEKAYNELHRE